MCAAIFDDDELPVDSVEDAMVGLLLTVDRETIEEDDGSDRYCIYEGDDASPGEWTDILELERFGYFGVLFKHSNSGWYVHSSDLPQINCAPKTEIPEIQFTDFVVRVSLFRCEILLRRKNNLKKCWRTHSGGLVMALTKNKLGELIYELHRFNSSLEYGLEYVRGISNNKEITRTKADVDETIIHKFYVIHPGEFIYIPRTTHMGDKVGLGYNNTSTPFPFL